MSVFKEEINKNIKKHHIGVIVAGLLLARFLSGVFFTGYSSGVNTLVESIKGEYSEYVAEFEGALSDELENGVMQLNAQMNEAQDKIVQLALGVEDGILRQKDYVDGLLECYDVLEKTDVTKALNNQLNYIKEDPERRYFMYTNGWVSLFQGMKPDYMYLIVLVLVMAPLFVREYETKMDVLNRLSKRGKEPLYFTKIGFAMVFSLVTGVLFFAVDALVVQLRFGIEHSEYPLQSLHIFMDNTSPITIGQHLLTSFFVTIIGGMLVSMCMILITLLMKKMIPAIIVFLSVLLLPIYMFEEATLAKFPNLTTLFCRSGYVVGIPTKESPVPYFMDAATIKQHLLVYCLSVLFMAFLGYVVYCKKGRLLCLGAVLFLTGCGEVQTENGVYNYSHTNMMIISGNHVIDNLENPRVATDAGSEALLHDAFYGCEPYTVRLGYTVEDELYYIKEYGEQNSFELCKTNLQTFETVSIYKDMGSGIVGYPYLRELKTEEGAGKAQIASFYVCGDTMVLYKENRLYQVNRKSGKESILIPGEIREFAFEGDMLYYITDRYELFKMKLNSGKEEKLCEFLVREVFVSGTTLYIESLEQKIYAYETSSGEMMEILQDAEQMMCVDENYIYCLPEDNVLNIVSIVDGEKWEIELEGAAIEVESYQNGELIYLYIYKNNHVERMVLTKDGTEVISEGM